MKRILSLLLVCIIVFGLCACNSKNEPTATKPTTLDKSENGDVINKQEPTEDRNNDVMKIGDVLYEDETLKLTLKEFDFRAEDPEDVTFFLTFEAHNKLDRILDVYCNDATVNSFTIYASADEEIKGGETAEMLMMFELTQHSNGFFTGEEDLNEIQFELSFSDYDYTIDEEKIITLYPNSDRNYNVIGYELQEGDAVIVDNDQFKIVYKGNSVSRGETIYIDYYIVSKDGKDYSLKVNGMVGETTMGDGPMAPNYINVDANKECHENLSIWTTKKIVDENTTAAIQFTVFDDSYQEVAVADWFEFEINKTVEEE